METIKMFVYGTLKEGGSLAYTLDKYRVSSTPFTLEGYVLYDLGWFPGVKRGNGMVVGEIHEFKHPKTVLYMADLVEGYSEDNKGNSLFVRSSIKTPTEDGKTEKVCIYLYNRNLTRAATRIESGVWEE